MTSTGRKLLISLAALALATGGGRPAYRWRHVAVGGGGFAPGIVFSPVEPGLADLRTDIGGAYRWDARAARWSPLQDGNAVGSDMGVESIAADPVDPRIVYLATGMGASSPAAIWRSVDRGRHWTIHAASFAMGGNEDGRGLGERLAIDPHHRATLFFGSRHDGLWRGNDGGVAFHAVAGAGLPRDLTGAPPVSRETPDPLFATGRLGGVDAVWRSGDGGARGARINDDDHQRGVRFRVVSGDPRRYGSGYGGTDGRGIVHGDPVGEGKR